MKRLQPPKGRERSLDLLRQRGGRYVFGSRARAQALSPVHGQARKVILILAAASFLGVLFGILTSQLLALASVIAAMILISLYFAMREISQATPDEGAIVIDVNRSTVTFPEDTSICGEHAIEDLNLAVVPEENDEHPDRQTWFICIEGGAGEDATGSWRFSVTLFGPGNRADLLGFATQIGHLGPWKSVAGRQG